MHKIALIVPCYNEEANIEPFYNAIQELLNGPLAQTFENKILTVFVNDGSKDKTLKKIAELNAKDPAVRGVSFSRNFGKEAALFAGVRYAVGEKCACDAAIILDADLQHPVSVIPDMISKWKEGFEVVEGLKTSRGKESIFHKLFSKTFYSLISRAVGMDMENSSDYKLLDKKVLLCLANLTERNTFFRALSFWCGFKKTAVYYEVQDRNSGSSKWSVKMLFKYAINNVISFTYAPLNIVTILGGVFLILALGVSIDSVVSYFMKKSASGIPTLTILMLFGFGGVMVSLGIIGVYIAQIYDEVKGRPQYIVGEEIG